MPLCEYEKQRQARIAENQAMIASLFPKDLLPSSPKPSNNRSSTASPVKRRRSEIAVPRRRLPKRKCRSHFSKHESENEDSDEEEIEEVIPNNLIVKLWPHKHGKQSSSGGEDSDDSPKRKRRSPKRKPKSPKLPVEITNEDLILVAERVADKSYDHENGTTCHQCRQKTDDLKTACRSKSCYGVRGQFCGPCLRNRYGEDAKEALMDPEWYCPPCRGICNCSFCMKKRGRRCTGIMIHLAKERGYNDVKSFLGD
ncbi:Cell division cycle-associated protein 7 [Desmophyllum pertusum]|uniref:Cell division cycle-associated protein 7 n=1 Tax=Desmophyllum pertusum TaxID=174260 RepID=A0A9W9ZQ74_9CNID|nr:Cell division cycle-associated protein 7 [Desmophyllum pertusum]